MAADERFVRVTGPGFDFQYAVTPTATVSDIFDHIKTLSIPVSGSLICTHNNARIKLDELLTVIADSEFPLEFRLGRTDSLKVAPSPAVPEDPLPPPPMPRRTQSQTPTRPRFSALPRRTDVDYSAIPKPHDLDTLKRNLGLMFAGLPVDERPEPEDVEAALEEAYFDVNRAAEYLLAHLQPPEPSPAPPPTHFSRAEVAMINEVLASAEAHVGHKLAPEQRALLIQLFGLTPGPDDEARKAEVLRLYIAMADERPE